MQSGEHADCESVVEGSTPSGLPNYREVSMYTNYDVAKAQFFENYLRNRRGVPIASINNSINDYCKGVFPLNILEMRLIDNYYLPFIYQKVYTIEIYRVSPW